MVKLASVCMSSHPTDKASNRDAMVAFVEQAASQNVDMIVFPEECLTGIGTVSMQQFSGKDKMDMVTELAEQIPSGDSTQLFIELAKKHDMYSCWGMAEKDPDRFDVTYNAAVLVGPEGYIGHYRKVHLPMCERFIHYPGPGDYPVFETRFGKVGLEICFDKAFPEVARTLALKGAQIIVNPTAWPNISGKPDDPDKMSYETYAHARAMENMVFFIDSNHCGPYMAGCSQIIGPNPGQKFAVTSPEGGMAVAEVDIEKEILNARIFSMGGTDLLKDRKPGTYGEITKFTPYTPYGAVIAQG